MTTLQITICAQSVLLTSLTRSDTGAAVAGVSLPATLTQASPGVWTLTFTEPAAGLTYAYTFLATFAQGSPRTEFGTFNAATGISACSGSGRTDACSATPNLVSSIAENADAPKSASGDQGSVTQHSLPDQIAADRYVKAAAVKRGLGIRRVRICPGNAADVEVGRRRD